MNKYYSKKYLWSNKNFIGIECFLHRNFIYLFIYMYILFKKILLLIYYYYYYYYIILYYI